MAFGFGFGLPRGAAAPFSPASLFSAGEQGAWYDPSDLSTLYQDAAGTTPVTAVEQPVGKLLDKSGRGNHATASGTARPTLSAKYNLLTYTEDFTNAVWRSGVPGGTISANTTDTTAPDGTYTADKATATAVSFGGIFARCNASVYSGSTTYKYSVYAKAGTAQYIGLRTSGNGASATDTYCYFNLSTGVATAITPSGGTVVSVSMTNAGNGWWQCVLVYTTASTVSSQITDIAITTSTGATANTPAGTESVYIWGADLRLNNDGVNLPVYQRVNASTDYATAGFPLYLSFSGAQGMSTPASIPFGTDQMTVWTGARKLSDAAIGLIVELSVNENTNSGSFYVASPLVTGASGDFAYYARGTSEVGLNSGTYISPTTKVLTAISSISTPVATLRVNGSQVATSSATQGTGNYGTYPLFIGARNLTTFPLTGRIYSLIVRGAASNASQISSTEGWVNSKTAAY